MIDHFATQRSNEASEPVGALRALRGLSGNGGVDLPGLDLVRCQKCDRSGVLEVDPFADPRRRESPARSLGDRCTRDVG